MKLLTVAAFAGICAYAAFGNAPAASATCGRNAIRLYAEPLAYEVVSGGKIVVPRTEISLTLDGTDIASSAKFVSAKKRKLDGVAKSPVYKKSSVGMAGSDTLADFGDFAVRLVARPDGVAYRYELKKGGTINSEQACLTVPKDARCWFNRTSRRSIGCEETIPEAATVGLEGHPEKVAAVARRAKDGSWYAAGITNAEARDYTLDTSFLVGGSWKMEIFRDAEDSDRNASNFVHEKRAVKAGEKIAFRLAQGGGFTAHFTK